MCDGLNALLDKVIGIFSCHGSALCHDVFNRLQLVNFDKLDEVLIEVKLNIVPRYESKDLVVLLLYKDLESRIKLQIQHVESPADVQHIRVIMKLFGFVLLHVSCQVVGH